MGLIKAALGSAAGVLADEWREFFYCEAINNDVLVTKGQKRVNKKRSSNTKGSDNIITNGSVIAVADGQCMIIVEQGKVVEVCADAGEFVYDTSTEPSIFYGGFGAGLKKSFQTFGKRFTFGGDTGKDQRVYYFNTKEIVGNKYGTANAVPFRVVDRNIGLDVDISIKCFGEYSYKLSDPILFYTNVCGNVEDDYRREQIDSQLKSELMTALQPAFAEISEMGIRYSALPGHTQEIADALNRVLSQKWNNTRGIVIQSFGVSSVKAGEEDEKMIKEIQRNAAFRDPNMAGAHLVGAQAEAMQSAAKNEGGMGAMGGFIGMNMAGNAGNANIGNLFEMGNKAAAAKTASNGWTCPCGQAGNTGKFCQNCGKPQPVANSWVCTCGTANTGNFCQNCGKKKPSDSKCDKCGWVPADPSNPPKFCPNCGDRFDSNDNI